LGGAAHLAWCQGDFERAAALREESLKLFRRLGDKAGIAASLTGLGSVARMRGDYTAAHSLLEEALPLRRELGDRWGIAESLFLLGGTAAFQSDHAAARPLLEEGLALFREVGERQGIADSLGVLGMSALSRGDYAAAHSLFEESQKIMKSLGDRRGLGKTFNVKGDLALNQGDHEAARTLYEEALAIFGELDDKWWLAWSLEGLAGVAAAQAKPVRAARIFGATEALREAIDGPRPAAHRPDYERWLAVARTGLDEVAWERAWEEGRAMRPEEAIEYASSGEEATPPASSVREEPPTDEPVNRLTRREREVALLVARGLTNRQISSELSISENTVANHVARILKKLNLPSRSQIAVRMTEQRMHRAP
jgi:non-specific serine/threonine protein kinase